MRDILDRSKCETEVAMPRIWQRTKYDETKVVIKGMAYFLVDSVERIILAPFRGIALIIEAVKKR